MCIFKLNVGVSIFSQHINFFNHFGRRAWVLTRLTWARRAIARQVEFGRLGGPTPTVFGRPQGCVPFGTPCNATAVFFWRCAIVQFGTRRAVCARLESNGIRRAVVGGAVCVCVCVCVSACACLRVRGLVDAAAS